MAAQGQVVCPLMHWQEDQLIQLLGLICSKPPDAWTDIHCVSIQALPNDIMPCTTGMVNRIAVPL